MRATEKLPSQQKCRKKLASKKFYVPGDRDQRTLNSRSPICCCCCYCCCWCCYCCCCCCCNNTEQSLISRNAYLLCKVKLNFQRFRVFGRHQFETFKSFAEIGTDVFESHQKYFLSFKKSFADRGSKGSSTRIRKPPSEKPGF